MGCPPAIHLWSSASLLQWRVGNNGQKWMWNQGAEAQDTGGHQTTAPSTLLTWPADWFAISGPDALRTRINHEDQRAVLKDRRQTAQSFKMRKEHEHYKRKWTLQNVTKHSLLCLSSSLRKILEQIIKQMAFEQRWVITKNVHGFRRKTSCQVTYFLCWQILRTNNLYDSERYPPRPILPIFFRVRKGERWRKMDWVLDTFITD